jgi:hypothetical protein
MGKPEGAARHVQLMGGQNHSQFQSRIEATAYEQASHYPFLRLCGTRWIRPRETKICEKGLRENR